MIIPRERLISIIDKTLDIAVIAAPVFFFTFPGFKRKVEFLASLLLVCLMGYGWAIWQAPRALISSIFQFQGQFIHTTAGIPIWGNWVLWYSGINWCSRFLDIPMAIQRLQGIDFLFKHNQIILAVVISLYAWLRRSRSNYNEIGKTLAEIFCIFYGVSYFWSFQYFGWSIPFWFFLAPGLMLLIYGLSSAYVYGFYAYLCGSYFLIGKWDFIGHPLLPNWILIFRNANIAFFTLYAVYLMGAALMTELRSWKQGKNRRIYPERK